MGRTQYPSGPMLVIRDCMKAICIENSAATKLLCALMYWYDHSSTDAVNGVFIVKRTQSELVHQDMCDETNVTTLHSVAIPFLQLLGYLDIEGKDGTLHYLIHVDKVHTALVAYSKKSLPDFLRASVVPQLQKFGIELTESELKEFVINSKILEKELQKIVIANKENCNCKRGRKPRTEEALRAKTKAPREYRELLENKKRDSKVSTDTPPEQPALHSLNGHKKPNELNQKTLPFKPTALLTPEEQTVFDEWQKMPWFKGNPQKVTANTPEYCRKLAPYKPTYETMLAVKNWATSAKVDKRGYYKGKAWSLYFLAEEYPKWASTQPDSQTNQNSLAREQDETALVPWSKDPASLPKKQKDVLDNFDLYEIMTKSEARKYGWSEDDALTPSLQNQVLSRLELYLVDGIPLSELKPQRYQIA